LPVSKTQAIDKKHLKVMKAACLSSFFYIDETVHENSNRCSISDYIAMNQNC
jgi:hypothetical protein